MQEAVDERTRARKELRRELKKDITKHFASFLVARTNYFAVTRDVVHLGTNGDRIVDFIHASDPNATDLSVEVDTFFKLVVGMPARPFRTRIIQKNVNAEDRASDRNRILDLVNPAKNEFHAMGDMLSRKLLLLHRPDSNPDEATIHRITSGLIRVIVHLSDCARYEEKHSRAVSFVQLLRIIDPSHAEAHMRLGLSLPIIPEQVSGFDTLRAFYHLCVFLVNRNVKLGSKEAEVVQNAVNNAKSRLHRLERQATQPEKLEILTVRFIVASWTAVMGDIKDAREAVVLDNRKLWQALREFLMERKQRNHQQAENALLFLVGIAIFVRHTLTNSSTEDSQELNRRITASDALLRNICTELCEAVCTDLLAFRARLRSRKKNRLRSNQKKRKARNAHASNTPAFTTDEIRRSVFNEVAELEHMPIALGPMSILLCFWSMLFDSFIPQQEAMYVKAYKAIENVLTELEKLAEHSGARKYWNTCLQILESPAQKPSLKEDILFCSFFACKNHRLFDKVLVRKVQFSTFFNGIEKGILDRAVSKLGTQSYESLVFPACRRHVEAFGKQIAAKADYQTHKLTSTSAMTLLISFAIRQKRTQTMFDRLKQVKMGLLKEKAAPVLPGGTPQSDIKDVLETPPDDWDSPLLGQIPRPYARSSTDDDSADFERNGAKRRKIQGSQLVPSQISTQNHSSATQTPPTISVQ